MHYHTPPLHPLTYISNPVSFSFSPQQTHTNFHQLLQVQTTFCPMTNHQQHQQDQEPIVSMDSHKNPNLETTENHKFHVLVSPSSSSQDFKRTRDHAYDIHISRKTNEGEVMKNPNSITCSSLEAGEQTQQEMGVVEESGRERLKRHQAEMAGHVWIPDIWGHEDLLKDWIDCTVFDSNLGNKTIMSARSALVQEGRSTLRIENRC